LRFAVSLIPVIIMLSTNPRTVRLSVIENRLAATDPALGRVISAVIARIGPQRVAPSRTSPFEALVRAVVYQSVSGKAAAAIFARLSEVVTKPLTPSTILALRTHTLTKVGLSSTKTRTIRELARWFTSNRKLAKALRELPDDEVIELLTKIPGIGAWTVNVLLIFNLGRIDVMPAADLGIRRGVQLADGLRVIATPASIYLWQATKLKLGPNDLMQGQHK